MRRLSRNGYERDDADGDDDDDDDDDADGDDDDDDDDIRVCARELLFETRLST